MKLYLIGHDYRYAVEQSLLVFCPDERPEFVDAPPQAGDGSFAVITLHSQGHRKIATAVAAVSINNKTVKRAARAAIPEGALERERALTHTVKRAFYYAVCELTGIRPPWGSLTGIRPAKLAIRALYGGSTPKQAERILKTTYDVSPGRAALCVSVAEKALYTASRLPEKSISIYVGIPFCPTRCAYCSFVSHSVEKEGHLVERYLNALIAEVEAAAPIIRGRQVISLYIGGGTPTTLSAPQLEKLLTALQRRLDLKALAEFTCEAGRPDTISPDKLRVLRTHGVDRVSVNPQTMQPRILEIIGRKHTPRDIEDAVRLVRESGIESLNMDIIAGLPGDTRDGFSDTLSRVLAFNPEQITVHTLARKRGSKITLEDISLPSPMHIEHMLCIASEILTKYSYRPYYLYRQKYMAGQFENIGWYKSGKSYSVYNLCMMEELHTVIAFGAGGVSKLVDNHSGRIERLPNPKYPHEYLRRDPAATAARLDAALTTFPC